MIFEYFSLGIILGLAVATLWWIRKHGGVEVAGLIGIACYFASWGFSRLWTLAPSGEEGYALALRLWPLGLLCIVFMYVGVIFYLLRNHPLITKMIWAVLLAAEGFAIVEYLMCKVIIEQIPDAYLGAMWGIEVSRYACGRAFGDYWVAALPTITTLFLGYLLWANYRSRTRS